MEIMRYWWERLWLLNSSRSFLIDTGWFHLFNDRMNLTKPSNVCYPTLLIQHQSILPITRSYSHSHTTFKLQSAKICSLDAFIDASPNYPQSESYRQFPSIRISFCQSHRYIWHLYIYFNRNIPILCRTLFFYSLLFIDFWSFFITNPSRLANWADLFTPTQISIIKNRRIHIFCL